MDNLCAKPQLVSVPSKQLHLYETSDKINKVDDMLTFKNRTESAVTLTGWVPVGRTYSCTDL